VEADRVATRVLLPTSRQDFASCDSGGVADTISRAQPGKPCGRATVGAGGSGTAATVGPLGHGRPLELGTRDFFEARFGHDLGDVRIHDDDGAAESARSMNALAFTSGRDIVFANGQFVPSTSVGKKLLAHELVHVVQQRSGAPSSASVGPAIQRAPAPTGSGGGEFALPWTNGGVSLFEITTAGVRILAGVQAGALEATVRKAIPGIARRIALDNQRITDPNYQVKTCFIVPTTTRFALYEGRPVLMLDPRDARETNAAHEMGHAIFHYLTGQAGTGAPDATRAANVRLRIADIYHRLASTRPVTIGDRTSPAGHWMVDPSQWRPGTKREHPADDPDEFFASAKEAYQTDPVALRASIARFKQVDSAVGAPAAELLALLAALFSAGQLSSKDLPEARQRAAVPALRRVTDVSRVEQTLIEGTLLDWLLHPDARPAPQHAAPTVPPRASSGERPTHPDLVTGPGGVKEQMERRFEQRLREKVLESAEEL
jgi:uncharacterized protein DUF4157